MKEYFLQSAEWEEFQKSLGREVFRFEGVLVIKLPLAFGKSYLYSAGINNKQNLRLVNNCFPAHSRPPSGGLRGSGCLLSLREIWRSQTKQPSNPLESNCSSSSGVVFFKVEPMVDDKKFLQDLLVSGFTKSAKEIQPQKTIVLDLLKSEEELLAGMHEKTRYNIRLACRMSNVKWQTSNDCARFWELMQKTAERDKFRLHTEEYYEKLLKLPNVKLLSAEYKDKTIAANFVLFHGETAYYLHGASDYEQRSLMAPYFLHWETIKYVKARGYKKYDLWGIDEKKWPGVTRFKRGFGGEEIAYIGSYDYVFQRFWYELYNLRNKLKNF